MDSVFNRASDPIQARCLGARLLPLTVGHLFLLRKYCPDVFSVSEIEFGTLAVASFICAHHQAKVERLLKRRVAALIFHIWARFAGKMDLFAERDRFDHYLRESLDPPKIWHDLSNPLKACQSPLENRLLVMLMVELHYPEAAALEMPVVKANALWATLGELRGKFSFADERTEGFLEFAARMDAEKLEKMNQEN